jgi:hypothetical protein
MKKIFLFVIIALELAASVITSPLLTYDEEKESATIKVEKADVGMSGFISHEIASGHTSILKNIVVSSFDANTHIATLKVSSFDGLKNNALPTGKWDVKVGDIAILAFGYTRALLIAPSEDIYYRISKSVNTQWLHPDLFATILSFRGHPTPLKEDFIAMSNATSVGLVFLYLNQKVYTLDAKSFSILSITDAPLVQEKVKLPFYSRVEEIDAAWWGEGSSPLKEYEPHYYELLAQNNTTNKELYEIIKKQGEKFQYILKDFEIGE